MNPRITFEQHRLITVTLNALYKSAAQSNRCLHAGSVTEDEVVEAIVGMVKHVFDVDHSMSKGFKGFVLALYHDSPVCLENDRKFEEWLSLGTDDGHSDGEDDV